MNLYNLHPNSESLLHFEEADENIPEVFWEKYKKFPKALKKLEKYLAKSTEYACYYAKNVLKGPFPKGEAAIAKSAEYAHFYAREILEGPFPAGEAAIASDEHYAQEYATFVLEDNFYLDGKLIAKA